MKNNPYSVAHGLQIQAIFSNIAKRYDLLNHILSFGADFYWWHSMATISGATHGCLFLDVAAGTGDSSLALVKKGAEVISTDFTSAMLKLGIDKFKHKDKNHLILASIEADAQYLPFKSNTFDGVTICYGIRNIENRCKAYQEFLRVLKPKKHLTILEFSEPIHLWLRVIYYSYIRYILPKIGTLLSGSPEAYNYLHASIRSFPKQEELAKALGNAGFTSVNWVNLSGGIVAIHTAQKPNESINY
jgi:demethylmenaquinone methyltransferase/2-methoxy-6-polyprenyl-1,4-benzoquinol methylase